MVRVKIFASRILRSRCRIPDDIDESIIRYSVHNNADPNLFRALFLIENYFRPRWFQLIERLVFKIGILKDPSLGPFQVKASHVGHFSCEIDLVNKSLDYVSRLMVKNHLLVQPGIEDFHNFGIKYNNTEEYGRVFSHVYDYLINSEKCSESLTCPPLEEMKTPKIHPRTCCIIELLCPQLP